ncbi:hypothetical protein [Piscinibacter sp. XHJ-5]|uniref:hypothetical protein n=1 Tax=Piscinibacter sp. XHJ-5 TaxID=3037797 RepID=UPI002452ECB2|nr:hypothetical protein [Piscinibacter sp. XHJ-5]
MRVVLAAIAGLVLMLGALLAAVFLGGLVLLATLRGGRRRSMSFGATPRHAATPGDVIDIEVREVATREAHRP